MFDLDVNTNKVKEIIWKARNSNDSLEYHVRDLVPATRTDEELFDKYFHMCLILEQQLILEGGYNETVQ